MVEAPTILVLCTAPRARVAAAVFAMALARTLGTPCGIAASAGVGGRLPGAGLATPAARRVAARLRARGQHATASGRLVWLPDRRVAAPREIVDADLAGAAAAASADLGRAALAGGVPAVLALPHARTAALDRVIAWYDGIVVVREPDATAAVMNRVVESLSALGRPVVCVSSPPRHEAVLTLPGLRTSPAALSAVAQLGFGTPSDGHDG
jgi:hypothetical protein